MAEVLLDGTTLTCADIAAIAEGAPVRFDDAARARVDASARYYAQQDDPHIVRHKWAWLVGGAQPEDLHVATRMFIEGHCAAVGPPLDRAVARALMATRANQLAVGLSGVRPEVLDLFVAVLEADIVPVVPAHGSVGAAGNPVLAHVARVLCRYGGEAVRDGQTRPAAEALAGLPELVPTEKEALSLINGSSLTTALAALAVHRAERALRAAQAACALSLEVVQADVACLSPRAMEARRAPGAVEVAARLRSLVAGSELVHAQNWPDSFSIRCAPTVLGAAADALASVKQTVERELNCASDNPLVFAGCEVVEAGNFHGAPVALAMDHLKTALVMVASIAERRVFRLTYARLSGLPSFLLPNSGANSGLMLAQYTAASLVSEARARSFPASADAIPTVQHHEDHVSMGPGAAQGALEIVALLEDVIAIELLCAAQGLDFRLAGQAVDAHGALVDVPPLQPGAGSRAVYDAVRERVPRWVDDRVMHLDLEALGDAVRAGVFR